MLRPQRSLTLLLVWIFTSLAFSAAAEEGPSEAEILGYLKEIGASAGLAVEAMPPNAKDLVQGQWYLEGLRQKECIDGFFYEFRPDNTAVNESRRLAMYEIRTWSIDIKDKFAPLSIYRLDGNFYLPSFECGLAKLVRGPAIKIVPAQDRSLHEKYGCKSDEDCLATPEGGCVLSSFKGQFKTSPDKPGACRCLKGPVMFGCVPTGSAWDLPK